MGVGSDEASENNYEAAFMQKDYMGNEGLLKNFIRIVRKLDLPLQQKFSTVLQRFLHLKMQQGLK